MNMLKTITAAMTAATFFLAPSASGGDMHKAEQKMYAFFYFMAERPEDIRQAAPLHAAYWKSLGLQGVQGGPFNDYSGGLILFQADGLEHAEKAVADDPFTVRDLLEKSWLKEWRVR